MSRFISGTLTGVAATTIAAAFVLAWAGQTRPVQFACPPESNGQAYSHRVEDGTNLHCYYSPKVGLKKYRRT